MTSPDPTSPRRRRGPVPAWLGALVEPLYRRVIDRRNRRYDSGRGVVEFDRPCISVGNLSAGGTGKTPMVALLVRWLTEAGHQPVIAMRGYGAVAGRSDEADEYRRRFPDLPIVAQPDRVQGLIELFDRLHGETRDADCILLDDGFQHRRIARGLDLVLVDATRSPFEDRPLPTGWLREPVSSLRRAGAVVITHAQSVPPEFLARLRSRLDAVLPPGTPVFTCRHAWTGLKVRTPDGRETDEHVGWLADRTALPLCAIGNPGPFVERARLAARRCENAIVLRDHAAFPRSLVARLARSEGVVLTTEKDWSRLRAAWPASASATVVRPVLGIEFDEGGGRLRDLVLDAVGEAGPPGPVG